MCNAIIATYPAPGLSILPKLRNVGTIIRKDISNTSAGGPESPPLLLFFCIYSSFGYEDVHSKVETAVRNGVGNKIGICNAYLRPLERRKISVIISAAVAYAISLLS